MGKDATELLDAYDALDTDEKRTFTAEFLRRIGPVDFGDLDESENAAAADDLLKDAEVRTGAVIVMSDYGFPTFRCERRVTSEDVKALEG